MEPNKKPGQGKERAKSHIVNIWKLIEVEKDGEIEEIPLLRYYLVFNIMDCEGIESKREEVLFDHDPIEEAEIIEGYPTHPR